MRFEFFPRQKIIDALTEGWRLIPKHDYSPGEYAILMYFPEVPAPMSKKLMRSVAARFQPPSKFRPNKTNAAQSRNWYRFHSPKALAKKAARFAALEAAE